MYDSARRNRPRSPSGSTLGRKALIYGERGGWLVAYSGTLSRKKGQQSIDLVRRKPVRHISGMNRQTRPPSAFSKVSVKSQTVIPREVRERLQLNPGDTLRYRLTGEGVLLDKAPASDADDPFVAFSEWSGEADEKAYGDL